MIGADAGFPASRSPVGLMFEGCEMRYTVKALRDELNQLIYEGHGRKIVHISKTTFTHNLEDDGCTMLEVAGLGVRSIGILDGDGGTKYRADGTEASRTVLVLAGSDGADSKGDLVDSQTPVRIEDSAGCGLLERLIEYWDTNGGDDDDEGVNGGDLVEFVAEWIQDAKLAIENRVVPERDDPHPIQKEVAVFDFGCYPEAKANGYTRFLGTVDGTAEHVIKSIPFGGRLAIIKGSTIVGGKQEYEWAVYAKEV